MKKMLKLSDDGMQIDELVLQQPCCKRAFIRGAFLATGSVSDPNKGYHFEIVCVSKEQADTLMAAMNFFEVGAKCVSRSGRYVVYLKEGAQIVEIFRVMEAAHSVMKLENIRVVKEVRGTVNRKVNCETANISKTVNTAVRQIEDIELIDAKLGLENLPEALQEIATVRREHPDTPLGSLGQYLDPPIGKSGVNHRLKKLASIAEGLR
jgi:DNA-binding protein WhiA